MSGALNSLGYATFQLINRCRGLLFGRFRTRENVATEWLVSYLAYFVAMGVAMLTALLCGWGTTSGSLFRNPYEMKAVFLFGFLNFLAKGFAGISGQYLPRFRAYAFSAAALLLVPQGLLRTNSTGRPLGELPAEHRLQALQAAPGIPEALYAGASSGALTADAVGSDSEIAPLGKRLELGAGVPDQQGLQDLALGGELEDVGVVTLPAYWPPSSSLPLTSRRLNSLVFQPCRLAVGRCVFPRLPAIRPGWSGTMPGSMRQGMGSTC